ncbi:carbon-nitrogen hydrolase family protein [Chloroflexota bacterium]
MKIHLVQFHPEINDKAGNLARILDYVDKGLAVGANLIAFGEQALVGYDLKSNVKYAELAEPIPGPVTNKLAAKLKGKDCLVLLGMPEYDLGDIYNVATLIGPDGIIGTARKLYLANFESTATPGVVYAESVWFKPGQHIAIFDTQFGRIGVHVCWDTFHPDVSYAQAVAGCWLILQPSATTLIVKGPQVHPVRLCRGFECNACMAYINIVGDQAGQLFNGGSSIIMGPQGCKQILSYGEEAKEEVLEYEVDPNEIYASRSRFPMLRDARPDLMKQLWEITEQFCS